MSFVNSLKSLAENISNAFHSRPEKITRQGVTIHACSYCSKKSENLAKLVPWGNQFVTSFICGVCLQKAQDVTHNLETHETVVRSQTLQEMKNIMDVELAFVHERIDYFRSVIDHD